MTPEVQGEERHAGNGYEPVIGLEVHAQLLTRSKMFCGCSAAYFGAEPNSHVCAVCSGMPGALPLMNRAAVEATILTGLALDCRVEGRFKFDRKNYQYPDLPKGYQITQYDMPIARNGHLTFLSAGGQRLCGITRVHLEEDTGKSTHTGGDAGTSLVDYNRSGVPLMEIVGEPDLRSGDEARDYFAALRQVLVYLGVCDGNLQEGSMRADVNISLRSPDGRPGTKVELKNLNSFRAVHRAIEFEIDRQRRALAAGQTLAQETRGWSEQLEQTVSQRSKEFAHDYRYFPEPDLPPVLVPEALLDELGRKIPELPEARRGRLEGQMGLAQETAEILTSNRELGDFYEAVVSIDRSMERRLAANWVTQDLLGLLNESCTSIESTRMTPAAFGELVMMLGRREINGPTAKELLPEMVRTGESARSMVDSRGLSQVSDESQIERWVAEAIAANPRAATDYHAGKTRAADALVGHVMKASRGKANVDAVRAAILSEMENPDES
jgi:aspartyl-tRNA(Asn)/glutamyl-tRNA(Gln) amidotransferase subunit B